MEAVAPSNEEAVEAWSGVLFDRWVALRDVVAGAIAPFSDEAYRLLDPQPGESVLDIGCGLGETTLQLAELVGPEGEVAGMDSGERFIEMAREEAEQAGAGNVSYFVGDVQTADLGGPYDIAFSRFGTLFCANPVALLRNVRRSLKPGGRLCMIAWRRKLDNEWLHRGELVADRYLEKPEETDEPACGPGPFSMAGADTVTDQFRIAGFEEISLHRCDLPIKIGDDLDHAIARLKAIA